MNKILISPNSILHNEYLEGWERRRGEGVRNGRILKGRESRGRSKREFHFLAGSSDKASMRM
jgi:hypothetical protein